MHDVATFIYEVSSALACSRQAARRRDGRTLRAAVLALSDLSANAGADRMATLCDTLREALLEHAIATRASEGSRGGMGGHLGALPSPIPIALPSSIEPLIDAIAEEFEQVTGDLQVSLSA
jgi:hypothetical protein